MYEWKSKSNSITLLQHVPYMTSNPDSESAIISATNMAPPRRRPSTTILNITHCSFTIGYL